jgi:hypothetical protein
MLVIFEYFHSKLRNAAFDTSIRERPWFERQDDGLALFSFILLALQYSSAHARKSPVLLRSPRKPVQSSAKLMTECTTLEPLSKIPCHVISARMKLSIGSVKVTKSADEIGSPYRTPAPSSKGNRGDPLKAATPKFVGKRCESTG